ncbi:DUF1702 family protein [Streptosporangium sp. NPDC000396]|uniref:DUF1702 family protein n=1 Tax=Streptosporangium sp. NPDC000396 TaxID=3366185 RepID=UPI003681222C
MSNAEGARTVAQSDGAGGADAERAPDAELVTGARRPTGTGQAADTERLTGTGQAADPADMKEPAGAEQATPDQTSPEQVAPEQATTAEQATGTEQAAAGKTPGAERTAPRRALDEGKAAAGKASSAGRTPGTEKPPGAEKNSGMEKVTEKVPDVTPRPIVSDPAELKLTRPGGLSGLLWQNLSQIDFGPRRFRLGPARRRLETAGQSFLTGFNAVIAGETERIDDLHEELRGFAYEGAGMACATFDVLTVTGGRRLRDLLSGQGMRYPHMIHMGAGWAYARLRMRPMWGIRSVHPLLRWLAFDGFGFHQGFFATDRTIGRQRSAGLMDRTRRAIFDQGLGRMLWFHECAGVDDVILRIAEFPAGRRADLWSGVGLAAAYSGGASTAELERLSTAASEDGFRAHLVQGSAFACASRLISGAVPEHTAAATPVLCGVDVDEAGAWTDTALIALGHNAHSSDHYQAWRAGIRKAWARRNRD